MKTLKDLTPDILAKISGYKEKCLEGIYNGERYHNFDLEKAKKAINWNYNKCGLKNPIILVAENPLEQQYLFNYLKLNYERYKNILNLLYLLQQEFIEITIELDIKYKCKIPSYFLLYFNFQIDKNIYDPQLHSQLHSQLDSQLHSQLDDQLHSQLDDQLASQLDSQLGNQLRSQLDSQLHSQLYNQLRSQLDSQLDSQLHSQLYNQLVNQLDSQLYNQLRSQLHRQLDSQLHSQLRSQLRSQLDNQLHSQLHSQLHRQLYSQLHRQLYSQLDSPLYSQLYNQLGNQLRSQLKINCTLKDISTFNYNYLFTLNIYSNVYYNWYEFLRKEFNLDLTINDNFQECFKLQRDSDIYSCIFSELIAVVCKYPVKVNQQVSDNYFLNSIDESAVIWSNSFAPFDCYYINGLNITKELFEKLSKKEYSFEDWVKEPNEEIKAAVISFYEQKFGNEYVFEFLKKNLKEIDTYVDKKEKKYLLNTVGMNVGVYTLFKGSVLNEKIAYVRCYCPSTDRMFFLGVNPDNNNAKDAIASLCQIPKELKNNLIEIRRVGEIFNFKFDEASTLKLKNKEINIENVIPLSGEEYFNKLTFEY